MELPDKSIPTEKKVVNAVVPKGGAKTASRPASRRFFDYVFAESPKAVLATVVANSLVPQLKSAGEQAFNAFLHGMLWQGQQPPSNIVQGTVLRAGGVVLNGGTNYNAMSNPSLMAAAAAGSMSGPYQDLILPTQHYAEAVYAEVLDLLNRYRVVTVGDLYEAAQLTPEPHHSNLGWYGLDGARITKESDGFRLALPKPVRV